MPQNYNVRKRRTVLLTSLRKRSVVLPRSGSSCSKTSFNNYVLAMFWVLRMMTLEWSKETEKYLRSDKGQTDLLSVKFSRHPKQMEMIGLWTVEKEHPKNFLVRFNAIYSSRSLIFGELRLRYRYTVLTLSVRGEGGRIWWWVKNSSSSKPVCLSVSHFFVHFFCSAKFESTREVSHLMWDFGNSGD